MDAEEFHLLRRESCWYCGGPLPKSKPALDGINELEGYRLDNVVPCCRYCNTARDLHLPMEWGRVLDIYRERYGQFVWPTQAGTQHWHPDAFPLRRVLHAIAGSSFAKRILREHSLLHGVMS